MLSISHILRMRQRQWRYNHNNPAGIIGFGCALVFCMLIVIGSLVFASGYHYLTSDLPSTDILPQLINPEESDLIQPTRFYDRTGEQVLYTLENPAAIGRQYLGLDNSLPQYLPESLVLATLASLNLDLQRDPVRLFEINPQWNYLTIARRLVSDIFLGNEPPGLKRHFQEGLLAAHILANYGREKLLTWYLNTADYGNMAYGVDAAALVYFGKSATDLTLSESAMLAAIAGAPALNPIDTPQLALERQQAVLREMLDQEYIDENQAQQAILEDLHIREPGRNTNQIAPAFINLALEQAEIYLGEDRLRRGGFNIVTSLDYDLQNQVLCTTSDIRKNINTSADILPAPDVSSCTPDKILPILSSSNENVSNDLGIDVVVLDPQTGELLALMGESTPELETAQLSGHPPGSIISPFIYLAGFSQGMSPASMAWDIPKESDGIQNPDGTYHGPVRLRDALVNDYIVIANQVIERVGDDNVRDIAYQLGLASIKGEEFSEILQDGGEITLIEASQAYGALANGGILSGVEVDKFSGMNGENPLLPTTILRIEDTIDGLRINQFGIEDIPGTENRSIISPQLAYLITHVLSDQTARRSSLNHRNLLEVGRPSGVKIGQTSSKRDTWTIGFTPHLVVGVWTGYSQVGSKNQIPAEISVALWHALIKSASQDHPSTGWITPSGIKSLVVCDPSGMLPTTNCPVTAREIFLDGNEPTHIDNLFQKVQINRITNKIATAFTPPELIEERVYMNVPPEAYDWVQQTNLPIPPNTYDVILSSTQISPNIQITSPSTFSFISGKTSIMGSAYGEDFDSYSLQLGEGLNPKSWLPIEPTTATQIIDGTLGILDTQDLSGLYTLQLLVVKQDHSVETSIVHVSIDNQPPKVYIQYPKDNQEISPRNDLITLTAIPQDDLALENVRFYINDEFLNTIEQEPFSTPWDPNPGLHQLRVVAADSAGNESESEVTFNILQ